MTKVEKIVVGIEEYAKDNFDTEILNKFLTHQKDCLALHRW